MSVSSADEVSISFKLGGSLTMTLCSEESEEEMLRKKKSPNNYWNLDIRKLTEFVSGSTYKGFWNVLGMHSSGKYNLFYGPRVDADFFDNMFHGVGSLTYPNRSRIEGIWDKGHMTSYRYYYPDDLCFGPYCQMPDRSFILERRFGLKPAGRSLEINSFDPREIPTGCYDTVDGFYDPQKKYVFDRLDPKHIIRIPTKSEHLWILKHCRKAWTEPAGFRPDLYENWYRVEKKEATAEEQNIKPSKTQSSDLDTSMKIKFNV